MYKTCSKCSRHLSTVDYHKLKRGTFGRHSVCRNCRSKLRKKKNNIVSVSEKICLHCNIQLSENMFYKNKNSNDGLQSYCKTCHKLKISKSNSELDRFAKIILNKYIKKQKNKIINITFNDIIKKYKEQKKLCYITKHEMTHKSDIKQRTDNIWNLSIYLEDECNILNYNNFHLVANLIYSIKEIYKLSNKDTYNIYNDLLNNS